MTTRTLPQPELRSVPPLRTGDPTGRPRRGTPTGLPRAYYLVVSADAAGMLLPGLFATSGRAWLLIMSLVTLLLFQSGRLYRPQLHLSVLNELPSLLSRSLAAAALVTGALLLFLGNQPVLRSFLTLALASIVGQVVARTIAYRLILSGRSRGAATHDALVLGGGQVGTDIASTLLDQRSYGLHPIGFLDDDPLLREAERPVPHLGGAADLARLLSELDVQVLIVAFGSLREAELIKVLRASERVGVEVFIVPRLYEVHSPMGRTDHIGAIPVTRVRRKRLDGLAWTAKRALDVGAAALAVVALSPVLAAVALAVRIEGGPGVLFRQRRIGLGGSDFDLLKFRSMKPADDTESATNWNIAQDQRVGTIGRILRRTSLDELPQLWNILRGEMSLVGPRPERPHFVQKFTSEVQHYDHRHRVPCGLTGLSQISGLRGDTSIAARARYDNLYIENWSLWLDVKIILATAREVVGARGA